MPEHSGVGRRLHLGATVGLVGLVLSRVPQNARLDMELDAVYSKLILHGINPYVTGTVPRPPSAWLPQLPLAWLDPGLVAWITATAGVTMVAYLGWKTLRLDGVWLPVVGMMVAASGPARVTIGSGNMCGLVAFLVGWAWLRRSGWPLGVTAALRVYPAVFWLAAKRRSAVVVAAVLTGAGLILVPDLGLDVWRNGSLYMGHAGNTSLASIIGTVPALGVGALIGWVAWRADFERGMCLAACAAVLVPGVSWPGYHLVMVPVVAWLVARGRWWVLVFVPLWFYGFGLTLGRALLVAALGVLTVLAVSTGRAPRSGERGADTTTARRKEKSGNRWMFVRRSPKSSHITTSDMPLSTTRRRSHGPSSAPAGGLPSGSSPSARSLKRSSPRTQSTRYAKRLTSTGTSWRYGHAS